jgi:NAD(P)-dependent dehydrogenase (short-subunit alcohol dehydrogenase family)
MTPGRSYFVTGANAGIGKATVEALLAGGGSVVMACRSREKAEPVLASLRERHPGRDVSLVELDLADLRAVRRAAEEWLSLGRPLDVLVNNAGTAGIAGRTVDGFELTVGTNHLGPFLLTALLLPRIRQSPDGRVVNVASEAQARVEVLDMDCFRRPTSSPIDVLRRYGYSKLMNVIHAKELAARLAGTSIVTASVHPGRVASEIWKPMPWPLRPIWTKLFLISNEEGARTSVHCATESGLPSGEFWSRCHVARHNPLADDPTLAGRLFRASEEAVESCVGPIAWWPAAR